MPPTSDDALARAFAGALRAQIRDHGPITAEWIGSTVKRLLGQLPNAAPSALGSALVRRRWAGTTPEQRVEALAGLERARRKGGRRGGRAAWSGTTKAERSAEMRRRAQKRAGSVLSSGRAGPSGSGGAR